jgi:hypothetical protein
MHTFVNFFSLYSKEQEEPRASLQSTRPHQNKKYSLPPSRSTSRLIITVLPVPTRAQRHDPSIPAPAWLKLVLVSFHPSSKAKEAFLYSNMIFFIIFYGPSVKCKALYTDNCILVSIVNFIHLLCSTNSFTQSLLLLI